MASKAIPTIYRACVRGYQQRSTLIFLKDVRWFFDDLGKFVQRIFGEFFIHFFFEDVGENLL